MPTGPVPTPPTPPRLPGRRRALTWGGTAAGIAAAGLVAYSAQRVAALRRTARRHRLDLDHDALVGEGIGEPITLVVCGDSAAAGEGNSTAREAFPFQVGSQLAARTGRRVEIRSFAVSGATTRDVAEQQVSLLAAVDADLVVLYVGVNDALGRHRPAHVREDTSHLLEAAAKAAPGAEIVLVGCPDLADAPGLPWPLGHAVGWLCRRTRRAQQAAAAEAGVAFARFDERPDRGMFGPDGMHPGPQGQRAAGAVVVDTVLERTRQERAWTSD